MNDDKKVIRLLDGIILQLRRPCARASRYQKTRGPQSRILERVHHSSSVVRGHSVGGQEGSDGRGWMHERFDGFGVFCDYVGCYSIDRSCLQLA